MIKDIRSLSRLIHSIRDIRKDIDEATRWREIEADGSQDVNVNHEIFADAINYASKREREAERAMGTPRWPRRKGSHPQKGSGALEMKGRMDVPRQVQETRKGIHLIQGSLKFLIR